MIYEKIFTMYCLLSPTLSTVFLLILFHSAHSKIKTNTKITRYYALLNFDIAKQRDDPNNICLFRNCASMQNSTAMDNKKAQLTLTNPRDAEACKNCSDSTCFVSFQRIPFREISNYRCTASSDRL